ncbi:hypothetical protein U9C48_001243 [Citrobacter farmeri]|nr:hypothetical protein [Citrobacter farmeri]
MAVSSGLIQRTAWQYVSELVEVGLSLAASAFLEAVYMALERRLFA